MSVNLASFGPTKVLRFIYSELPSPGITRPIFILGCGRSGTTIFGTALSKHRDICYLNEPRHLWFSAYPETDIWTPNASSRNGRLFLSESDADYKKSNKLSRLFRFETIINRKPVLIEKLPINDFRLQFIYRIFPDARFIHIYRNGLEVARSIEKANKNGDWFGENYYKWCKLVEYSSQREDVHDFPTLCTTDFNKGLFEWRLSTEAVVEFRSYLSDDSFFELNYRELIDHPGETMSQVLEFIGICNDPNVDEFISCNLVRKSRQIGLDEISEKEQILGGRLLPLSMDGENSLTNRLTDN